MQRNVTHARREDVPLREFQQYVLRCMSQRTFNLRTFTRHVQFTFSLGLSLSLSLSLNWF